MYFDLFHVRYGLETLLTDSRHNLDLAFVAAVWRYTRIVGKEQYRFGVDAWPPPADWSTGLVVPTTALCSPSVAVGASGAAASGSGVAEAARASGAESRAEGAGSSASTSSAAHCVKPAGASGAEPRAEGTGSRSSGSGGTPVLMVGPPKYTSV